MKLSIVIPAFNEEKLLPSTLAAVSDAVSPLREAGWQTEIVVCNNNSTDRTGEIADNAGARVVFEPVNQIGRSRNTGAAAATGDWIVFIDADSRPSPRLFLELGEAMAREDVIGGGAKIELEEGGFVLRMITGLWNWISRIKKWAAGSFVFCRAEAFRAVGGFDPSLFASEELDLSDRLKKLGRSRSQRFVILARERLLTSSRKSALYSNREIFCFVVRALFRPRTLRSREQCHLWYDGRR